MFEYLEPDASGASNLPPAPGDESLPVPPNTGLPGRGIHPNPRPERVRHLVYGSRAAILHTIKLLHACGYADPNDWSDPIPVPPGGSAEPAQSIAAETRLSSSAETWMAILTKTLLLK
jgi:hypothetical protein